MADEFPNHYVGDLVHTHHGFTTFNREAVA